MPERFNLSQVQKDALLGLSKQARLGDITLVEQIHTPWSRFDLFITDVQPDGAEGPRGRHVLKLDSRPDIDAAAGVDHQTLPLPAEDHLAQLLATGPTIHGTTAALFDVGRHKEVASLVQLLDSDTTAACGVLSDLCTYFAKWNIEPGIERTGPLPLLRMLPGLAGRVDSLCEAAQRNLGVDRECAMLRFEGESVLLPNPIAYLTRDDCWAECSELAWPRGHSHGEMHAGQIFRFPGTHPFKIIDFARYSSSLAFFDAASMEIDLLFRLLPPITPTTRKHWLRWTRELTMALLPVKLSGDPRVFAAAALLEPLRDYVDQAARESKEADDFRCVYHLAAAGAALRMLTELPGIANESGGAEQGSYLAHHQLSLLLAAAHLHRVLEHVRVPWGEGKGIAEIAWLQARPPAPEPTALTAAPIVDSAGAVETPAVPPSAERLPIPDDADGPLAVAIAILDQTIFSRHGNSELYLDFVGFRDRLRTIRGDEQRYGVLGTDARESREKTLRQLNTLAMDQCGKSLEDLNRDRQLLRQALDRLEKEHQRYWTKNRTLRGGDLLMFSAQFDRIGQGMKLLRDELQAITESECAAVALAVERRFAPPRALVAGRWIHADVTIRNIGQRPIAFQSLEDRLADGLHVKRADALRWTGVLGCDETITLSYDFRPARVGKFAIGLSYLGEDGVARAGLHPDTITVRAAHPACITAERFYHDVEEGIEVLVRLANTGEETAHQVHYVDSFDVDGKEQESLAWQGDLPGGEEVVVQRTLPKVTIDRVRFAGDVLIGYEDGSKQQKEFRLAGKCKPVGYQVPAHPALVGRRAEWDTIKKILQNIDELSRDPAAGFRERLLLIEGTEGSGKTRLVHELREAADKMGFRQVCVDSRGADGGGQRPLRQALWELLDIKPDDRSESAIRQRLHKALPDDKHAILRQKCERFLAVSLADFDKADVDAVRQFVPTLLSNLAQQRPIVLVLENLHVAPEDIEKQTLQALAHQLTLYNDVPLLLCISHRPTELGLPQFLQDARLLRDKYKKLVLGPLDEAATGALVDSVVAPFPRCSRAVHHFIFQHTAGNPLFVIELIRWLTHPDEPRLVRVAGEWELSPQLPQENAAPGLIRQLILERIHDELSKQTVEFLRFLAVLGDNLSLDLIKRLAPAIDPNWQLGAIGTHLDALTKAGFLTTPAASKYAFTHDARATLIYEDEDFAPAQRALWHMKIAEVLLAEPLGDQNVHLWHLARHLLQAPESLQRQHVDRLMAAARLERSHCNLTRSCELYDRALQLVDEQSLTAVELRYERAEVHDLRGEAAAARQDLSAAFNGLEHPQVRDANSARLLRIWSSRVNKALAHTMVHAPKQQEWMLAHELLLGVRRQMEGFLRIRRWWPPRDADFLRETTEVYVDLANIALEHGSAKECDRYSKLAASYARRHSALSPGHQHVLSQLSFQIGGLYLGTKRAAQALTWLEAALAAGPDEHLRGRVLLAIADAYRTLDQSEPARAHYEQAVKIQESLVDHYGLARSCEGLADLAVQEGDLEHGRYHAARACAESRLLGDIEHLWRIQLQLCEMDVQDGRMLPAADGWTEIRPLLFDGPPTQRRVDSLRTSEQKRIYDVCARVAEHFQESGQPEREYQTRRDVDELATMLQLSKEASALDKLRLGRACMKTERWHEAVVALEDAKGNIADIHGKAQVYTCLGELYQLGYATSAPPAQEEDELLPHNPAAHCYKIAAGILLDAGEHQSALQLYKRLVECLTLDETALYALPDTFSSLVGQQEMHGAISGELLKVTEELLLERNLATEAGDLHAFMVRASPDEDKSAALIAHLARSEELYRSSGQRRDLIWGLNILIPTFQRFQLWNEIVRCFRELFSLYGEEQEERGLFDTLRALSAFNDKLETPEVESLLRAANKLSDEVSLTRQRRMSWRLHIAKFHSELGRRAKNESERREHEDVALAGFHEIFSEDPEGPLAGVALNDAALILGRREEFQAALELLNASLAHCSDSAAGGVSYAIGLTNRADLQRRMGNTDAARADYEEAVPILERVRDVWETRRASAARDDFTSADAAQMRYDLRVLAQSYQALANLLLETGGIDAANSEHPRELLAKSQELFEEVGDETSALYAQFESFQMTRHAEEPATTQELLGRVLRGALGIAAPPAGDRRVCPICEARWQPGQRACSSCHQPLCPNCAASMDLEATVCPACQTPL